MHPCPWRLSPMHRLLSLHCVGAIFAKDSPYIHCMFVLSNYCAGPKNNNNIWNLIETVLLSFLEKLKILLETTNNTILYKNLYTDIDNFREYTNESFMKVSNVFGSTTCPGIDKDWFHITNYKEYLKK